MKRSLIAIFAGLVFASTCAKAQSYPDRPIRLIIPFPPGGAVDTIGRIMGAKLQERFNQPVVIESRVGAGGNIATDAVAKSAPDGYTLLLTTNGHAVGPSLFKKLPYDPVADFEPVTQLIKSSLFLVVSPDTPAKSLQELLALARSKPGVLNYGTSGIGSVLHLAMELLKSEAKVDIQMVSFRGDAPLMQALTQNVIQVGVVPQVTALAQIEAGAIRAIATTSATRTVLMPNLPTIAEQGIAGFDIGSWNGIFAPARTPAPIVKQIRDAVAEAVKDQAVIKRFVTFGAEPVAGTPEQLGALLKTEIAKFAAIIRDAKIPQQ